ncbi:MAG: right-handed parallel beta-helix repeat-containing protein [Thermoanaerobaculia bacterium]|nr:right-handed parallel beta-helix repeat-containing protein [Thermoanaerobaculia bacterium]
MIHSARRGRTPICLLALLFAAVVPASPARAATFAVSKTADTNDGVCDADCSLREAIVAANAAAGGDTITFGVAGLFTISGSALPQITGSLVVNGTSAPGWASAPVVRIDGAGLASGNGLSFAAGASSSSISALAVTGFPGHGLEILSATTVVTRSYVGLALDGTTDAGNGLSGIRLSGANCAIGNANVGNVISGNGERGILVQAGGNNVTIRANRIGTNAAGTAAVPNDGNGIYGTGGTGVFVGGALAGRGNTISGNGGLGIDLDNTSASWTIHGNNIGVDATGAAGLGNAGGGIRSLTGGHTIGSTFAAGRNVISGNGFNGIALGSTANGVTVFGNYIGTNAAGTAALAGQPMGLRVFGSNCTIGGADATTRNVISGNTSVGISLESPAAGCVVSANYIGVNSTGTAAVPNGGGVSLGGSNHTLGGDTAGESNVISGNSQGGVSVSGTGHLIRGNYIGTNAAGTAALANGGIGIRVLAASGVTIGGTAAGEGNLVSGNGSDGIVTDGASSAVTIQGNKVGTNAAGTAAIPNQSGVVLDGDGHMLGGGSAAARNLVSGNSSHGVVLAGSGLVVRGNYVGTDAAGNAALANGGFGLRGYGETDCEIGGPAAADGNVIAGNVRSVSFEQGATGNVMRNNILGLNAAATADLADTGSGIEIYSPGNTIGTPGAGNVIAGFTYQGITLSGAATSGNVIQGNWIGTNPALAPGLGNAQLGIYVLDAVGNKIGGTAAGEGNVIANNGFIGLWVEHGDRNEISGNSIFGNALLGIDIGEQGIAPNDGGDGDGGGNRNQNYPLISSAVAGGGVTTIQGLLINEPNTEYRVEFFSSPVCSTTGFGEGRTFRGSTLVTTGGGGQATLATVIPLALVDPFLTATVTDPLGNTSEFSPCVAVGGPNPGKLQFYRNAVLSYEGVLATGDAMITRSHGLAGTASVTFTSTNDTAIAGQDYTDSDQVLTFAPWEVVKVVKIPILFDPAPETDPEYADLALASPTGGATLGLAASDLYIFDNSPAFPGIVIDDSFVDEGASGTGTLSFEVHLSPTDHPVTVTYATEDGSATAGEDYTAATGTLAFPVSATTQTQQVEIVVAGDTDVEAGETLLVAITTAPSGGMWIAYDTVAAGEIRNDDFSSPPPATTIFADGFELGSTALWSNTVP